MLSKNTVKLLNPIQYPIFRLGKVYGTPNKKNMRIYETHQQLNVSLVLYFEDLKGFIEIFSFVIKQVIPAAL